LSYGATSSFARGSKAGEFAIRSYAQTEKAMEAIELSLATLARLKREGVTQDLLESSQTYLLGQFPLGLETSADWAAALSEVELYHLGTSYIEGYGPALRQVRVADVARVIRQTFPDPEDIVTVLIGDAHKLRVDALRYGSVTEMKLTDPEFFR
jgi:zinc protease